jgi:hypothetical protein
VIQGSDPAIFANPNPKRDSVLLSRLPCCYYAAEAAAFAGDEERLATVISELLEAFNEFAGPT